MSMRLRTMSLGFPAVSSSTSGLRLEIGIRASRISQTASMFFSWLWIIRRVLVMWPGYHWMFISCCISGIVIPSLLLVNQADAAPVQFLGIRRLPREEEEDGLA